MRSKKCTEVLSHRKMLRRQNRNPKTITPQFMNLINIQHEKKFLDPSQNLNYRKSFHSCILLFRKYAVPTSTIRHQILLRKMLISYITQLPNPEIVRQICASYYIKTMHWIVWFLKITEKTVWKPPNMYSATTTNKNTRSP